MVGRETRQAVVANEPTLVPAHAIVGFLQAAHSAGTKVLYVECLYKFAAGGTRPSMELSRTAEETPDWDAFVEFTSKAAALAEAQALEEGAIAYFEVGLS